MTLGTALGVVQHPLWMGPQHAPGARWHAPAVSKDDFVFRVCFTDDDPDVRLRLVTAPAGSPAARAADMCGFEVDCGHAEVRVFLDPDAPRRIWLSSSPERCR